MVLFTGWPECIDLLEGVTPIEAYRHDAWACELAQAPGGDHGALGAGSSAHLGRATGPSGRAGRAGVAHVSRTDDNARA